MREKASVLVRPHAVTGPSSESKLVTRDRQFKTRARIIAEPRLSMDSRDYYRSGRCIYICILVLNSTMAFTEGFAVFTKCSVKFEAKGMRIGLLHRM
jgi:hypothetical protein